MASVLVHCIRQQGRSSEAGSFGCFEFIDEEFRVDLLAVQMDIRPPQAALSMQRNPPMDRGAWATRDVLFTDGWCSNPQIRSTVIQPVAIDVISEETISGNQAKQLAMHSNAGAADGISLGTQVPCPLTGPLRIGSVDKRIGDHCAIARQQWYASGQAIVAQDDRLGVPCEVTGARAEHPILDCRDLALKGLSACLTGQRDLIRHPFATARLRAVATAAGLDAVVVDAERRAASPAHTQCATVPSHRDDPQVSRGAKPRPVSAGAGISCVNFTR